MAEAGDAQITDLLLAWGEGDEEALQRLIERVYGPLRRLAAELLRSERRDHTLQTAALVNEAYLRLIDQSRVQWRNRGHFFAIAAQMMRRILVDHARRHRYQKRGGGTIHLPEEVLRFLPVEQRPDLVALDDALTALAAFDAEQAQIVELRFFGGLSLEEIAATIDLSIPTVSRRWRLAKAWLLRELVGEAAGAV